METTLAVVLFVPTMVITVLVFAAVIRRLLGVRVGLVRAVLAAVFALFVATPILQALAPPDPENLDGGTAFLLFFSAVAISALLAMVVLVILEVLLPTGSLPGPVELWRGTLRRVARARRYARSSASRCGTGSAGSCAAARSRGRRRRRPGGNWPARCARRSTRAASRSSSSASSCPPAATCCPPSSSTS